MQSFRPARMAGPQVGVDFVLRHQDSLQNEAVRVAGLVNQLQAARQERDDAISRVASILQGVKANMRASMQVRMQ